VRPINKKQTTGLHWCFVFFGIFIFQVERLSTFRGRLMIFGSVKIITATEGEREKRWER